MLLWLAFLLLVAAGSVVCTEVRIKRADELTEFSNNVNKGTNYSGTTVLLDSDIDFSGKEFCSGWKCFEVFPRHV